MTGVLTSLGGSIVSNKISSATSSISKQFDDTFGEDDQPRQPRTSEREKAKAERMKTEREEKHRLRKEASDARRDELHQKYGRGNCAPGTSYWKRLMGRWSDATGAEVSYGRALSTAAPSAGGSRRPTAYSTVADEILSSNRELNPELNPHGRTITCTAANPIVCAIDVTGSMGNWSKIIWDKIMMQGYLEDPSISFCGVGDANSDKAPLQVGDFKSGGDLDDVITRMWLEGGGGGQNYETYELAAYFYARHCEMPNTTGKGFMFFTGDEGYYPAILKDFADEHVGDDLPRSIPSAEVFKELRRKFHVFFIHKPYFDEEIDEVMVKKWEAAVGSERVLHLRDPKAVVDVMLGAIAVVSGSRTLDKYILDMEDRGQDGSRVEKVKDAIGALASLGREDAEDASRSLSRSKEAILKARTFLSGKIATRSEFAGEELAYERLCALRDNQGDDFPEHLVCPVTGEPFRSPVFTVDGHTYEEKAIAMWLEAHGTSPNTGLLLDSKALVPNFAVKKALADYLRKHEG